MADYRVSSRAQGALACAVCLCTFILAPIIEFRGLRLAAAVARRPEPTLSDVLSLSFAASSLTTAIAILALSSLAPLLGLWVKSLIHRLHQRDVAAALALWSFSAGGLLGLFWYWTRVPAP